MRDLVFLDRACKSPGCHIRFSMRVDVNNILRMVGYGLLVDHIVWMIVKCLLSRA